MGSFKNYVTLEGGGEGQVICYGPVTRGKGFRGVSRNESEPPFLPKGKCNCTSQSSKGHPDST